MTNWTKNTLGRKVRDNLDCLDLSNWKNGVAIDRTSKATGRTGMWEEVRRSVLDMLRLSEESEFGVLRQSYKGKYIALNFYVGKGENSK